MYAECVEKVTSDSWISNSGEDKWEVLRSLVEPRVAPESWCRVRPWSTRGKIPIRRTHHVSYSVRQEFGQLVSRWKADTTFLSSDTDIVLHPAYQRIMGMGERVLPLIFQNLRDEGGNWFWALRHITGENPVSSGDIGKSKRMKEAWLTWGRERHYL
jgi:hypothetical protein